MSWLAARGVTTIVAFKRPQSSLKRLAASAKKSGLVVIAPRQVAPKKVCKSSSALVTCAVVVATPAAAVRLARRGLVDYVVIRVKTPLQLRMLRGSHAKRSRILALLPLSQKAAGKNAWRSGIAYAAADPALDLGVRSAPGAVAALGGYLSQLPQTRTASAAGPNAPTSLLVTGRSTSSVTLRWTAAAGGVTGYGIYTDGNFVLNVSAVSITLTGLTCGRLYTFGVDAYDDGGRSGRITTSASTDPCAGGGGGGSGGAADALPPSAPLGLVKSSSTQTSIAVSWTAATDNVGVAGYGLYRNGSATGSSLVASASFSGLACGTTYTLAVDAYDAAGNRSGKTSLSAATSACAGGGDTAAPSTPGTMSKTGSTMTSISVSWGASTDNVGVAGYGLYRNGSSAGTSASTSTTFGGLACGTSYTLAADAYDAAGNRSGQRSLTTATSACPPPTDTQAPSVPQGMTFGTITETTIALSWNASTDNVGIAGYRLLRDNVSVATVATPGYTFTGLTCGTSYTLAIEAYDAAGNVSNRALATGTVSTSACGAPPPPPPPPTPGPAPTVANLWVDTNGGSCARQSTPGGWVDSQACSWGQAYTAAQTGDLILVRGGNYGDVDMSPNKPSITAPGVTFRTANGENVVVNDFENGHIAGADGGNNITFIGPVTARTFRSDRNDNIVVDGWNVDCNGCIAIQIFHVEESNNVIVRNSEIQDNTDNSLIWLNGANLTFENNRIHHAGLRSGSGAHTECMYAWDVTNLTLKRNHFYECAIMDVFITGSAVSNGGFIENNVFEIPSTGGYAFHFRSGGDPTPDPNNWDFRYNTFVGALSIGSESPVGSGGMRVTGNAFLDPETPCGKNNTTFSYNAFVSGACGTNSITNSLATYRAGFTSTGVPGNYALKAGSVLLNKGNPTSYPAQDRAGNARTSTNDIGAYEGT